MALSPSSVFLHFKIKRLDQVSAKNRSDYLEGKGRYIYKDVEKTLSDDDLKLERIKAHELEKRNNYLERVGGFEGKHGIERERALGLSSDDAADRAGHGATWDQYGICDSRQKAAQILSATKEGYYVDGVITIARDDVATLGLESKQDFQRMARSHMDGLIDSWSLFNPGDGRWYAEYHTDADHSLHIHLTIWDKSGRWPGAKRTTDSMMFSRQQLLAGDDYFRDAVYRTIKPGLSMEKDFLRNRLQAEFYRTMGRDIPENITSRCEDKAHSLSNGLPGRIASLESLTSTIPSTDLTRYLETISKTLPEDGSGSIRYAYTSKETKAAVNDCLRQLYIANPALKEIRDLYLQNTREHGALKGLTANPLKRFVNTDKVNFERTLKNILLKAAVGERDLARSQTPELQPTLQDGHSITPSPALLNKEAARSLFLNTRDAFRNITKDDMLPTDEASMIFTQLFAEAKDHARLSGSISAFDISTLSDAYQLTPLFETFRSNLKGSKNLDIKTINALDTRIKAGLYQGLCRSLETDVHALLRKELANTDTTSLGIEARLSLSLNPDNLTSLSALHKDLGEDSSAKHALDSISKSIGDADASPSERKSSLEELLGPDRYQQMLEVSGKVLASSETLASLTRQELYWASKRTSDMPPDKQEALLDTIAKHQLDSVATALTYKTVNNSQELYLQAKASIDENLKDPEFSARLSKISEDYRAGYPLDSKQVSVIVKEFEQTPRFQALLDEKIEAAYKATGITLNRQDLSDRVTRRLNRDLTRSIQKQAEQKTRQDARGISKQMIRAANTQKGVAIQQQLASLKGELPRSLKPAQIQQAMKQPGAARRATLQGLVGAQTYDRAESIARALCATPALKQTHAQEIYQATRRLDHLSDAERQAAINAISARQLDDTTATVLNQASTPKSSHLPTQSLDLGMMLTEMAQRAIMRSSSQGERPHQPHKNQRREREQQMIQDPSDNRVLSR